MSSQQSAFPRQKQSEEKEAPVDESFQTSNLFTTLELLPLPTNENNHSYSVSLRPEDSEFLANLLKKPHFTSVSLDKKNSLLKFKSPHDAKTLKPAIDTLCLVRDFLAALQFPPPSNDNYSYKVYVRKEEAKILEYLLKKPHFNNTSLDEKFFLFKFHSPYSTAVLNPIFLKAFHACEKYKHLQAYDTLRLLIIQLSPLERAKAVLSRITNHHQITEIRGMREDLSREKERLSGELQSKEKELENEKAKIDLTKVYPDHAEFYLQTRFYTPIDNLKKQLTEINTALSLLSKTLREMQQKQENVPQTVPRVPATSTKKKVLTYSLTSLVAGTVVTAGVGIPLGFAKKPTETAKAFNDIADALNSPIKGLELEHFPVLAAIGTGVGMIVATLLVYYGYQYYHSQRPLESELTQESQMDDGEKHNNDNESPASFEASY